MAPANVSVQYVEKATEELIEEAVTLFSKLMPADPAAISFVGGDISLIPTMARAMIKPLALVAGEMYTATNENGVLVGFTLWLPPGRNLYDTGEEQLQMGFNDFMSRLSDDGKAYFPQVLGKDFPKVIDSITDIEQTELDCYWCSFAFVRADYQGKGVTKAMFALVFEKIKKTGEIMALATTNERNVAIYEKIGFELKGFKEMPSPWSPWPAWIFVKDTKTL